MARGDLDWAGLFALVAMPAWLGDRDPRGRRLREDSPACVPFRSPDPL
ncbi:hypothetical protein [Streptomyces sp. MA15]|nr:hypothetical protein [Streptomyces sp. MA15]MDN3267139.1 hypothetical protein [Streptomyces sp. MA15]